MYSLKKNLFFVLMGVFIAPNLLYAQEEDSYTYENEFIWGFNKNTSGGLIGGVVLKKSVAINEGWFQTYGLELMNVKSPFEVRYPSTSTGNFFIWDKVNYLYAVRMQYGRDKILFKKAPQQGVQIIAMAAAGPSIGVISPYYIEIRSSNTVDISETLPYEPGTHLFNQIWGTGRIFQGIQDSKLAFGANIKTGLSFEFGTFKNNVTGFEVGFLVDAYTQRIPLISGTEPKAIFPTAFITLFYGTRK